MTYPIRPSLDAMSTDYSPVRCEFHDVLEALAATRRVARIQFRSVHGKVIERTARIQDVFSRSGAEYLVIHGAETIRLDQIVDIDGSGP